jgi:hypothetical protein
MRIVVVGVWFAYQALTGQNLDGKILQKLPLGNRAKRIQNTGYVRGQEETAYTRVAPPPYEEAIHMEEQPRPGDASQPNFYLNDSTSAEPRSETPEKATNPGSRLLGFSSGPPTFLGWAGWIYAVLYFPVVQGLWLAHNWPNGPSSGSLKLVRAIGVAVTALPLTMDTKARYAVKLELRFGRWANRLFTYLHASSTLALGIMSAIMLIVAVIQMSAPMFLVPIYVIFSSVWMFGSFALFPPFDGGMSPNSVATFAAGLAMGVFGGAFTSAPAFASMNMAPSSPGVSLGTYLSCESVSIGKKFVAIFP